MKRYFIILLLSFIIISTKSFALIDAKKINKRQKENTIIKADKVQGDQNKDIINAIGNVEVKNSTTTATSDEISYDKSSGWITVSGNVVIKDLELGNIYSDHGEIKDDFSQGKLPQSKMIFYDGSYFKAQEIERKSEDIVILKKPIYAICPDDEIAKNNEKAGKKFDLLSIKSSSTTIDQEKQIIKTKNGVVRLYNFPIFYTPYISFPMKNNKRESGFLTPSYINNSRFNLGIRAPYFLDIAPNIDIILTPTFFQGNQIILKNEVHQIVKYGEHKSFLEIANNKVSTQTDRQTINRTQDELRYNLQSVGKYEFTQNSTVTHNINTISDRNYLRDYHFDFAAFTLSEIDYEYTKKRDYFIINAVRFQELETLSDTEDAQFILPSITHYIESEKPLFYKEKYGLQSNFTTIAKEDGVQYRRLSLTPEVKLPFNFYGNLVDLNAKFQWDYYSLSNNVNQNNQELDQAQSNYKPLFSATWRLPLIQKLESNTLLIEPTVSFVSSSFKKNFIGLPNEDSINSELTVNNIFNSDRIAGYDRNESGERISYGAKTAMFNDLGQFELSLAQSYLISNQEQDVSIRGFNENNKSNIVGQFSYRYPEHFNLDYLFQLNESSYDNEVNAINASFSYEDFTISANHLLIKKGVVNETRTEQGSLLTSYQFTPKFKVIAGITRDFATRRNLLRSASIEYGGCCVIFKFITSENNTANLTKTQRSHSINVVIRGF